jgi:hypothetical protein
MGFDPNRPTLRHAHIDVKGGELAFAAVCTSDRSANKADLCGCGYRWRNIFLQVKQVGYYNAP